MKNTAMQRILLFLLCISIWLIYLLQKELAAYGIYTVIPYRISEVMSLIPKLGILTAVIWFLCLCLQKEKQLPDKIFLVVMESPMIISNILEKQEYWITYSADDRDASKGKLRMIR